MVQKEYKEQCTATGFVHIIGQMHKNKLTLTKNDDSVKAPLVEKDSAYVKSSNDFIHVSLGERRKNG